MCIKRKHCLEPYSKYEVLKKTNCLLSFHCNLSICYDKQNENFSMYEMKSIKQYNLGGCSVGIANVSDLWSTLLRQAQVASYMYQVLWWLVQAFKKHYSYYRNNLRDCNVGITDQRDSWYMPLRWLHVAWYTYQVSSWLVQAFKPY
jgi:hypothetical protein